MVWRQPEGLGSSGPRAGEQSTTAERTWEEVWACRRSKPPLLGKTSGGGVDDQRNIFLYKHMDCRRARLKWATGSGVSCMGWERWALLVWSTGDKDKPPQLSMTAEVSMACHNQGSVNKHLLHAQSPQRSALRRALQPSTTHCCSHSHGNAHKHWCCHFQILQALPTTAWGSLSLPRVLQLGKAWATFLWVLATVKGPEIRHWLLALPIAFISLEASTAPYQGDNSLIILRKEAASIQTLTPKINNK